MSEKLEHDIEEAKQQFQKLVEIMVEEVHQLARSLSELFDSLEPYQKYEILHPKKKPRGSIRRNKKKR